MPRRGRIENLMPPFSPELAREMGAKGGKAGAISKREKKLLSQLYAESLAEEFDIELENGEREHLTGAKLVSRVIRTILAKGGAPAVSMLKEMREGTEGSKIDLTADIKPYWPDELKGKIG